MSNYSNAYPPDYFDDDEADDYDEYVKPRPKPTQNLSNELQQDTGIKIIPRLGVEAGLNKSTFDIQLDTNAQQWFDQIHQYWRQCKTTISDSFIISILTSCLHNFQLKNRQCCRM